MCNKVLVIIIIPIFTYAVTVISRDLLFTCICSRQDIEYGSSAVIICRNISAFVSIFCFLNVWLKLSYNAPDSTRTWKDEH